MIGESADILDHEGSHDGATRVSLLPCPRGEQDQSWAALGLYKENMFLAN